MEYLNFLEWYKIQIISHRISSIQIKTSNSLYCDVTIIQTHGPH
uniref:Uncharacterized protein n=1 Tax=Ciona intestinalis TaxID=7719 RepID=H2XV51_CIOIN